MKSSHTPAMVKKTLQRRGEHDVLSLSFYRWVIRAVSGSLMIAGTALNVYGQSPTDPPATPDTGATGGAGAAEVAMPAPADLSMPPPAGTGLTKSAPKTFKNEVGATADFMFGQGTVTIPVGYALNAKSPAPGFTPEPITGKRSSVYYGATLSYSYGRSWYVDVSYENGTSSGSQSINFANTIPGFTQGNFTYNDDSYQIYLRYNFQNLLQGTRFKAYLRGGVTLGQATLLVNDSGKLYKQTDTTSDILGNFGFGLTYSLYARPRFKLGMQMEAEGFYGSRSQKSTESLDPTVYPTFGVTHGSLNNDLYGGIGRITLHADWRLGQSGRWRLSADAGFQYKYTMISYIGGTAPDESLYGPYAKLGLSFVF